MGNKRSIKQESVKKNYVYNTLYQVLTLIIPFITTPYLSRVLGSNGIGIYSFTNSIVAYFSLFAALGTASYGQREIAMHRNDTVKSSKLFWEIEILSITATGVTLLAWILWIIVSSRYTIYYKILTLNIIAVAFDISWYFGGLEKFKSIVIRNTIVKLSGMALLFLLVRNRNDTLVYVGIMAAMGFLGNLSMWTSLPKMLVKVDLKSLHPFNPHLKQTFAYFIPTIATSVYTVLDKTMIGAITKSEYENGCYEQATKIIRIPETLLFSLNTVMSSRQSYLFAQRRLGEIKDKIDKSFEYLLALAIPFMFGIIAVARNFVPWFFGSDFSQVVSILYFMSPLPLVISVSNILGSQYLTPSGQRARSARGIITGAIVNFTLNSFLIPSFGADGAAFASVFAESIISIIYMHMSKGFMSWHQLAKIGWKKIIAGFLMFLFIWFIGNGYYGNVVITIIQILLGAAIYGILLLVMKDKFAVICYKTIRKVISNGRS